MKKTMVALLALAFLAGCTSLQSKWMRRSNPYEESPYYTKYLNTGSQLDRRISATLDALRLDPWNAPLHNQLGELLLQKGIQNQPRIEFRRAIASDKRFYPAWYNLGLVLEMGGDDSGAIHAFRETIEYKPGHAAAHFQLALLLEGRGRTSSAVHHYSEAIRINPHLLSPTVNPRVVDAGLIDRALMELYPRAHSEASIELEPTPPSYPQQPLKFEMAMPSETPTEAERESLDTSGTGSSEISGTNYPTRQPRRVMTEQSEEELKGGRWNKYLDRAKRQEAEEATVVESEPEPEPAQEAEPPEEDPNDPGF